MAWLGLCTAGTRSGRQLGRQQLQGPLTRLLQRMTPPMQRRTHSRVTSPTSPNTQHRRGVLLQLHKLASCGVWECSRAAQCCTACSQHVMRTLHPSPNHSPTQRKPCPTQPTTKQCPHAWRRTHNERDSSRAQGSKSTCAAHFWTVWIGGEPLRGKCSTNMRNSVTARIQSSCGVLAHASKCPRTAPLTPCPEYTALPTLNSKPRPPTLEYNNPP